MFCPKCGNRVTGKFCSECGTPLNIMQEISKEEKPGLWSRAKDALKQQVEAKKQEQEVLRERLAQMDREGIPYCPKCYSTHLSAHKKGFGFGKALVGGILTAPLGGIGAVAGGLGSGKAV